MLNRAELKYHQRTLMFLAMKTYHKILVGSRIEISPFKTNSLSWPSYNLIDTNGKIRASLVTVETSVGVKNHYLEF